jgi:hypothetical protein
MNRNPAQRSGTQRRRPPAKRTPIDIWQEAGALPDVEPVIPSNDPTALVRSLGEPPLADAEAVLIQFATVIERSASIAAALALSAGVLASDDLPLVMP